MSKQWKIAIGLFVAAVVTLGTAGIIGSVVAFRGYERGWVPEAHAGQPQAVPPLEVRLVDDDADGVPDRGVIDTPVLRTFDRGFWPARGAHLGRSVRPGRGLPFGPIFGPFSIIGGLVRLAFLTLLVGLGVVLCRHWYRTHPPTPAASQQEEQPVSD